MTKKLKRTKNVLAFAGVSALLTTPIYASSCFALPNSGSTTNNSNYGFGLSTSPIGNSSSQEIPTKPSDDITVWNITDDSANISFIDNATDEDGFKVYIYDKSSGLLDSSIFPNPIIVPKNDTKIPFQNVNLTNLNPDTTYMLKITSFNQAGESTPTSPDIFNGGIFTAGSMFVPEMPGEYVGVWNITETGARISFKDNSYNEDGFKAYVYKYDSDELVDTLDIDAKTGKGDYQYANLIELESDTLYKVRVSAYNGCGESELTTPSSLTNGRFRTTKTVSCPQMPGEYVGVYKVTSTSARVSFLDNSDNEDGFRVYVYEYNTDKLIDTISVDAQSGVGEYQYANIENLTPDTLYKVRVSAYNNSCESQKTEPSSKTNGRFKTEP